MPRLHDLLIILLVGLRPLVWDGDPASPANIGYLALVVLAVMSVVLESSRGMALRWSGIATVVGVTVVASLPMCLMAMVPPEGRAYGLQLIITAMSGWYLLQVLPGRGSLIQAALLGGLAVEAVIALAQPVWVLPAMAQANAGGNFTTILGEVPSGDIAERIANGGIFGTFTLSNLLAAWMLLAVPVAFGAVRAGGSHGARIIALLTAMAGTAAFLLTASKGSWLIAAGVLVVTVAWHRRAWWALAVLPFAGAALLAVPRVSSALQASATVRWEYWQGAVALWWKAPWFGHGWGAFGHASAAVMPLTAEPTRLVHQGLLEVAVSAGALVALLWGIAGLALVATRPRGREEPTGSGTIGSGAILLTTSGALVYGTLLGGLDGNLGWWPGGGGLAMVPWALVLGLLLGAVVIGTRSLPVAPRSWLVPGMIAFLLHGMTDIDFHSFACLGTLAIVAVLAGGGGRVVAGRWPSVLTASVAAVTAVLMLAWGMTASAQRQASDDIALLSAMSRGGEQADLALVALVGREVPAAERPQVIRGIIERTRASVGDDYSQAFRMALLMPPGPDRLELLTNLRSRLPWNAGLRVNRADDLAARGRWDEALEESRSAISLAPACLPIRRRVAALLEQAARAVPERAPMWWAERNAILAEVERLTPVVNSKNR